MHKAVFRRNIIQVSAANRRQTKRSRGAHVSPRESNLGILHRPSATAHRPSFGHRRFPATGAMHSSAYCVPQGQNRGGQQEEHAHRNKEHVARHGVKSHSEPNICPRFFSKNRPKYHKTVHFPVPYRETRLNKTRILALG